jgi:hypothetical protein
VYPVTERKRFQQQGQIRTHGTGPMDADEAEEWRRWRKA